MTIKQNEIIDHAHFMIDVSIYGLSKGRYDDVLFCLEGLSKQIKKVKAPLLNINHALLLRSIRVWEEYQDDPRPESRNRFLKSFNDFYKDAEKRKND